MPSIYDLVSEKLDTTGVDRAATVLGIGVGLNNHAIQPVEKLPTLQDQLNFSGFAIDNYSVYADNDKNTSKNSDGNNALQNSDSGGGSDNSSTLSGLMPSFDLWGGIEKYAYSGLFVLVGIGLMLLAMRGAVQNG